MIHSHPIPETPQQRADRLLAAEREHLRSDAAYAADAEAAADAGKVKPWDRKAFIAYHIRLSRQMDRQDAHRAVRAVVA